MKHLSCMTREFPAKVKQGGALPSRFSSRTVHKGPLPGTFSATFFTFMCFFVGDFTV